MLRDAAHGLKLAPQGQGTAYLSSVSLVGSMAAGMASILGGALAWFSRGWSSPRTRNRFSDLLVYTFAAAGMLYLAQLWTKGAF